MGFMTIVESAAASAVGTDLMDGERLQTSSLARRVVAVGLGGSTAVGDWAIDLFYGSEFVGRFYNTTTDNAIDTQDMLAVPGILVCSPNEPIHCFVHDPSNGNAGVIQLAIAELPPRTYGRRR
jgi:hypothetical protein